MQVGGELLEAPKPLPWYPNRLAWHFAFSRAQLRKLPMLEVRLSAPSLACTPCLSAFRALKSFCARLRQLPMLEVITPSHTAPLADERCNQPSSLEHRGNMNFNEVTTSVVMLASGPAALYQSNSGTWT